MFYAKICSLMNRKEQLIILLIMVIAVTMIVLRRMQPEPDIDHNAGSRTSFPQEEAKGMWVAVVHDHQVVMYFDSGIDGRYTVAGNVGEMHIEVRDGRWHVEDVDCYDFTCKNMGWMDAENPLPIICLPNDIVIVDAATAQNMTAEE